MRVIPKRILTLGIVAIAAIAGKTSLPDREQARPEADRKAATPPPITAIAAIHPRLSDAGDRIAFSRLGAIWRMPSAGGTMTRLTDGSGFDVEPAWSPDGKRIAYINSTGFFGGPLRLIDAESGAPIALPRPISALERVEFHPSGLKLLGKFQEAEQGGASGFSLSWLDLERGELSKVNAGGLRVTHFALSRDGRRIAVTSTRDVPGDQSGNDGPEADVWLIPAEGGEPRKLVAFPARIHDLCWTADDRALDVSTEVGAAHNDLWEIPLDDPERGARRLTFGAADEDRPSVSKDGRRLLYTDNRLGATALVLRDLVSKREETLAVSTIDHRAPVGRLAIELLDATDRSPVTGRVSIRHEGGKYQAPPEALYRLHRNDLHFYANARTELDVPAGRYEVSVARGPEYKISRFSIEAKADATTSRTVALERWTDRRAAGWYSGESHIHANYGYGPWYNSPRTMLLQCSGEDLGVANFMVANSDGEGVYDREYFRGRPDSLSGDKSILYWNEEFRSTLWGHMTLLKLKHLVEPIYTGFQHTTRPYDYPTNSDVGDLTHDQGGHVNYTHPAANPADPYLGAYTAKALPMDVALGKIDSIDVMGTNHDAAMPLWYRLLNCGFRIPASAGTDCFLNRIPSKLPGSDRAYVRIDGAFSYDRWIEGLRAGRTFVTNGPMLDFTVNERGPGGSLTIESGAGVRVRAKATSRAPLDRVELILNGAVAAVSKAEGDRLSVEFDRTVVVGDSSWLAIRAIGPNHPDQPNGSVFAHSSPVYVQIPDRPINAKEDAKYFLAWIDRLAAQLRKRDRVPARTKARVDSQLEAARVVYERLASR